MHIPDLQPLVFAAYRYLEEAAISPSLELIINPMVAPIWIDDMK
jgi:hypothetical protein